MGAWIEIPEIPKLSIMALVAPFVGAWIEIGRHGVAYESDRSLPSWERGLKFRLYGMFYPKNMVAPFVGAWIEI